MKEYPSIKEQLAKITKIKLVITCSTCAAFKDCAKNDSKNCKNWSPA